MIQTAPWRLYKNFVVDGFDSSDLWTYRREYPGIPLSVFTKKEFDFQHYSPSMFWAINNSYGTDFPIGKENLKRQFEGDTIAQFAVLEGAVRNGYYKDEGWIDSKARAFCKLDKISSDLSVRLKYTLNYYYPTPEHLNRTFDVYLPTELSCIGLGYSPEWIKYIKDKRNWVYQLKQVYSQILKNYSVSQHNAKILRPTSERKSIDGLVEMLQKNFGKNAGVVLYGSATFSSGDFNDYDCLVLVDSIRPEHYELLESQPPKFDGKDVDVVFVRKTNWENYVIMNPFSLGIVKKGMILSGDVDFPKIDENEAVLRVVSRACGRIRMLHNIALNWAADDYEELKSREGLLKSLSKVPRYILSACLQLKDLLEFKEHTQYENSVLDEMLSNIGIARVEFKQNERIPHNLFKVMEDTAEIIERFYTPEWIDGYSKQIEQITKVKKGLEERFEIERDEAIKQKEFIFR